MNVLSYQKSHKYLSSEIQKAKTRHCDAHLYPSLEAETGEIQRHP